MEQKSVYHLIAFNHKQIEAEEAVRKYEEACDEDARKEFRKGELYHYWMQGPKYMGTFENKQDLIDLILQSNNLWGLSEGGYYSHLLIEKHYLNVLEGQAFEDSDLGETWFKGNYNEESDIYSYAQIERPECFEGSISFL